MRSRITVTQVTNPPKPPAVEPVSKTSTKKQPTAAKSTGETATDTEEKA